MYVFTKLASCCQYHKFSLQKVTRVSGTQAQKQLSYPVITYPIDTSQLVKTQNSGTYICTYTQSFPYQTPSLCLPPHLPLLSILLTEIKYHMIFSDSPLQHNHFKFELKKKSFKAVCNLKSFAEQDHLLLNRQKNMYHMNVVHIDFYTVIRPNENSLKFFSKIKLLTQI